MNNNKRQRSPGSDTATPAKKPCDPRTEATAPRNKPRTPGPSEAQMRHAEAVKNAREGLAALAQQREAAKAQAESEAQAGYPPAAGLPSLSPGTGMLVNNAVRLKKLQLQGSTS